MRLDGKTAVITGAASGIGRATAEVLANAGAHVILGDISVEQGEAAAAAIRGKGKGADFIRLDVTDLASIDAFKQAAYAKRPQIDVVVNVAGGLTTFGPIAGTKVTDFDREIAINLKTAFLVSQAAIPHLLDGGLTI